jgi:serine/threonine protein phosphatase PrpC
LQAVVLDDVNATFELLSKNCNRSLYAIYDGHSGSEASELASQHLHRDILLHPDFNEVFFSDYNIFLSLCFLC